MKSNWRPQKCECYDGFASYEAGQDDKRNNKGDNGSGENRKECPGNEVEVVSACDEKRGTVHRKEGDGNESTREKEERKTKWEGGRWE